MSIGTARSRLPQDFVSVLYECFPLHVAERVLSGCATARATTLRVNTLKTDVRTVLRCLWESRVKSDRVSWYSDGLVIKNRREREVESLSVYEEGMVYLQSLSSMVPALALAPLPGERVLDLAAAPGSKTTQMAAMMNNVGSILANELDSIRAQRLEFNLARQGVTIAEVRVGDGGPLGKRHPETFDRVLVDVPCSGEGLFQASQPATYRHWSKRLVTRLRSVQRRLLRSGIDALKPGGVLVYSTCTLGYLENELLLMDVLHEYGESLRLEPLGLRIPDWISGVTVVEGRKLREDMKYARRIIPTQVMEGFFVARLRKLA